MTAYPGRRVVWLVAVVACVACGGRRAVVPHGFAEVDARQQIEVATVERSAATDPLTQVAPVDVQKTDELIPEEPEVNVDIVEDDEVAGDPCNGMDCNDDNPCTDDLCDPDVGCVHSFNAISCEDGNPCTAGDYCVDGACMPGEKVFCDDGNACTLDACSSVEGCIHHQNQVGPCDDGDECTGGDLCLDGVCVPGPIDLCPPCSSDDDGLACDDGDLCNGKVVCVDGKCTWSEVVQSCVDNVPYDCTVPECDPSTGLCVDEPVEDGVTCDDGDACTGQDTCTKGECAGVPVLCDDTDACTVDSCNADSGECVHVGVECADENECTTDSCDALAGCVFVPVECDDAGFCTDDSCEPDVGCIHTNLPDGTPCDEPGIWLCAAGQCVECVPTCDGKMCGPDECGGNCGECDGPQDSCVGGQCICQPACEYIQCGPDGCGGTCECYGDCVCQDDGTCLEPEWVGKEPCYSGPDCGPGEVCNGACWLTPGCTCKPDWVCYMVCVGWCIPCDPQCEGKECGPDGCSGTCGECGQEYECVDDVCVSIKICGNGVVEPPEECDDGNVLPGDSCDENCKLECQVPVDYQQVTLGELAENPEQHVGLNVAVSGKAVAGNPDCTTIACDCCNQCHAAYMLLQEAGDEIELIAAGISPVECAGNECDYMNNCEPFAHGAPYTVWGTFDVSSGAGVLLVDGFCECEAHCDGKMCDPDGCGGSCGECDAGSDCVNGTCVPDAVCGNGIVEPGEECDDGNLLPGDGCDENCTLEAGPDPIELCGATGGWWSWCGSGCGQWVCGDPVEQPCPDVCVELCECPPEAPGWGENGCEPCTCQEWDQSLGYCPDFCESCAVCGNGIVEPGEWCDDGNVLPDDGCDENCEVECQAPPEYQSVALADLADNPQDFSGEKVAATGFGGFEVGPCNAEDCGNMCCHQCGVGPSLEEGQKHIAVSNGAVAPVTCSGDECNPACEPFELGELYLVWGEFSGSNWSGTLSVDGFCPIAEPDHNYIRIETDKDTYEYGEPVEIALVLVNVQNEPVTYPCVEWPTLEVTVWHWADFVVWKFDNTTPSDVEPEDITVPANSELVLSPGCCGGDGPQIVWDQKQGYDTVDGTIEDGPQVAPAPYRIRAGIFEAGWPPSYAVEGQKFILISE